MSETEAKDQQPHSDLAEMIKQEYRKKFGSAGIPQEQITELFTCGVTDRQSLSKWYLELEVLKQGAEFVSGNTALANNLR